MGFIDGLIAVYHYVPLSSLPAHVTPYLELDYLRPDAFLLPPYTCRPNTLSMSETLSSHIVLDLPPGCQIGDVPVRDMGVPLPWALKPAF